MPEVPSCSTVCFDKWCDTAKSPVGLLAKKCVTDGGEDFKVTAKNGVLRNYELLAV